VPPTAVHDELRCVFRLILHRPQIGRFALDVDEKYGIRQCGDRKKMDRKHGG
jgi:hypothetical protein